MGKTKELPNYIEADRACANVIRTVTCAYDMHSNRQITEAEAVFMVSQSLSKAPEGWEISLTEFPDGDVVVMGKTRNGDDLTKRAASIKGRVGDWIRSVYLKSDRKAA